MTDVAIICGLIGLCVVIGELHRIADALTRLADKSSDQDQIH